MATDQTFLLIGVDEQEDFIAKNGRLSVKPGGCAEDADRTAVMIRRYGKKIRNVLFTLDTHDQYQIFHPLYWLDAQGKHPEPFTVIASADVRGGRYHTFNPADRTVALAYIETLEAKGRFQLMIWPEHCLAGTAGAALDANIAHALEDWVRDGPPAHPRKLNFLTKGTYTHSEHYGALEAEVPDPKVPATSVNMAYIQGIQQYSHVGVLGQASSHCVRFTIEQLIHYLGDEVLPKLCIFVDAMSPVQTPAHDYGPDTHTWLRGLEARGANLVRTDTFFN